MSASWKQLLLQSLLLFISCRHINTKTSGATPAPLPPITPTPTDVRSVDLKGENRTEKVVVLNPISLTLECNWTENHNNLPNITGYWEKDGDKIESATVLLENKKYNLKKEFSITNEKHLGNYSCIFEGGGEITFILAAPRVGEVKDKPIVSYVRDTGVIQCKMEDSKPMPNTWHWFKENGTEKEQIDVTDGKYEIHNKERKSSLMVHNLTEADAGVYYCGAVYAIGTTLSRVEMKVITIFEPLKPFIAIVVEVIILVAAILLYEKSRSKAGDNATGNKVDADQTDTPTQGENDGQEGGSAMRQRKV